MITGKIYGKFRIIGNPVLITSTPISPGLVSKLDYAAYLGREIEKAYLFLHYEFKYVQDSAPRQRRRDRINNTFLFSIPPFFLHTCKGIC